MPSKKFIGIRIKVDVEHGGKEKACAMHSKHAHKVKILDSLPQARNICTHLQSKLKPFKSRI